MAPAWSKLWERKSTRARTTKCSVRATRHTQPQGVSLGFLRPAMLTRTKRWMLMAEAWSAP